MDEAPRITRSTCCYCGTGCGVLIHSVGARIVHVEGDPEHPANFGKLCTKGNTLHLAAVDHGRALTPMLRERRDEPRRPVAWERALRTAAERFAAVIRQHGPDAVGFYLSGQLLTEDYYVFNKLARVLIGTNNIDSNSRLCMSSAVAAYKATLGADAVPCCYEDIDRCDLMMIAGANPAFAHPIVFRRIEAARAAHPEQRLIVVDPRRTDTAAGADLHLALTPGSDTLLYSAMLHVLLWEGYVDHAFIAAHTNGFEDLRRQIAEMTPGAVAATCGISADDIVTAARWFGQAKAPLSLWCQGLNQSIHGTANGAALIHLHLATGKIGKPGMGPFSLTGQPNAMGGREVGAMANLLPGHRSLANAGDRTELAHLWGVPDLTVRPGYSAVELFDAVHDGRVKALWIACTNPAQSMPDLGRVREALDRAEFVVMQEAWSDTETAAFADLLLPAATWGEKDGTVTNSERRITRVRAAVPPPGEAKPDWRIARDFARALETAGVGAGGCQAGLAAAMTAGNATKRPFHSPFAFESPSEIFAEHVATTLGRDLDIGGLSHAVLDRIGPQQWPFPNGAVAGGARLYGDRRFAFADGKARFVALEMSRTAEVPDARHPFRLITGRLRDQWHGMSRTGRIPRLFAHEPEPNIRLHPADLARRGWVEGTLLQISNRRGAIVLPAASSDDIRPGQAFVAMHWGRRSLSHAGVNGLTTALYDPHSKQPELKHAAVRIEAAALPWRLIAMRSAGDSNKALERVLEWRARLEPLLGDFAFATLALDGRERPLVVLRVAASMPLPDERLSVLARLLDLDAADCLDYRDPARGIVKRARFEHSRLSGILLGGEVAAEGWLRAALRDGVDIDDLRRWIFAPRAIVPVPTGTPRRVICTCFDVGVDAITDEIRLGRSLAQVQEKLKCGTSCGSCGPELRRLWAGLAKAD